MGASRGKGYIHGFSASEQDRLYQQARFLEERLYSRVDFSGARRIVELGSGVGAQTEILLERFPHLHIDGVDASEAQLERARLHLAGPVAEGRVTLTQADARKLPFADNTFDGAFLCWILEHVPNPIDVLRETGRVLAPGARLYCTEVLNATLFLEPYSPATQQFWFAFNDHQWNLGGDPFVGAKLGNLLLEAGFQHIETFVKSFHYDSRTPKLRAQMIDYWTVLLLSGTPALLEAGRITEADIDRMRQELDRVKHDKNGVFFYSSVQATAKVF
jgi:ubiquinone/menaquinone biosynthesis C-methylase UbiE